ncbi:MAG: hypothetical protein NC041_03275 [Bacteroides sp.]|nr:hypothetical protein [Prevotella sp.]MCM1408146.1 hypothetical protein [Treponema brennaborense]MCM1469470.1 hypothetical protein [Bacteroides sp.]
MRKNTEHILLCSAKRLLRRCYDMEKEKCSCYNNFMNRFNYYGLIIMAILMMPNIVYAVKHKSDTAVSYDNKTAVIMEQIGRYACFVLMIFNIPHTYFDFRFDYAIAVYLSVNGCLCFAYLLLWAVFWNKNSKAKALLLSILPSCIFLFSGIITANIPLIVFAVMFAAAHISISYKNASDTAAEQ